ncbi:MAG TPA: hypothetical protein VGL09_13440 [Methylomirabilota bacterium]|jgi:hypothetical protein
MDNTHSVRAGAFLAAIVREVDPVSRLVSIGDVDDGYFILLARHSRLAGGCTIESATVARAIAGDEGAHDAIAADFKRCLDGPAA